MTHFVVSTTAEQRKKTVWLVENTFCTHLNKVEWRISLTPADDRTGCRITPKEFTVQVQIWSLHGPTAKIPSIWHHKQGVQQNLTLLFHLMLWCISRCVKMRLWWGFLYWNAGTPIVSSDIIITLCCLAGLSSWTGCNSRSQLGLAFIRR